MLWLLGDHALTFIGGLFISIWLARHLGPANFGVYGYALAILSIFSSVAQLGLGGIAVKELVETKNLTQSLSTIVWLRMFGSIIGFAALLLYLIMVDVSSTKFWMTLVIGLSIFINPIATIDNYFDSKVLSKYKVIARKSAYLIKSGLIILFIINDWSFENLAYIILSEYILSALLLMYYFWQQKQRLLFQFSFTTAKSLLQESWPLIISGLGAILYLKMDQIMVVSMISETSGGFYAAAVRYSSIFFFIHSIILTTFFPKLIALKNSDRNKFHKGIKQLSALFILISILVILGTYLFITPFISLTFGVEYLNSVPIIMVHIWSLPLVFLGAVLSKWLIIEKLTRYSILRHVMGLLVNLILNMLLIPKYGAIGAAIASIAALFFAVIVIMLFHPRLRLLGSLVFNSISLKNLKSIYAS